MHSVSLRIPFCAGHRLLGHKGKCKHLHGHNYTAIITVAQPDGQLDAMGMVIDFGDLKEKVKRWIDSQWDHNMILNTNDPLARLSRALESAKRSGTISVDGEEIPPGPLFDGKQPFLMSYNPTAENMARHLALVATALLTEVRVLKVEIVETENCSASFSC